MNMQCGCRKVGIPLSQSLVRSQDRKLVGLGELHISWQLVHQFEFIRTTDQFKTRKLATKEALRYKPPTCDYSHDYSFALVESLLDIGLQLLSHHIRIWCTVNKTLVAFCDGWGYVNYDQNGNFSIVCSSLQSIAATWVKTCMFTLTALLKSLPEILIGHRPQPELCVLTTIF